MSVLLLAMALAGPAPAGVDHERREIRAVQAEYGRCLVKKRPNAAREFVLTPVLAETDLRRAVRKVADSDCLAEAIEAGGGVEMTFPGDTMRYTLSEALVRREFPDLERPSLKDAGKVAQPTFDEAKFVFASDEERKAQQAVVYLAKFGECVVRTDTASSYVLLMTEADTEGEKAAFASLRPTLSACMLPGHSLSFTKSTLRGTIAMNFYRLAHAPSAGTAAGASK